MSWGASTIGKVTQTVDIQNKMVSSTFDTILFRLTVIPIVGWFKVSSLLLLSLISFVT